MIARAWIVAAMIALAAAPAAADELGRRRGVGMSMQDELMGVRPDGERRVGIGLGLHVGWYARRAQWRLESAAVVTSPSDTMRGARALRLGGAVRLTPLSKVLGGERASQLALAVDLGAGRQWYADGLGGLGAPYLAAGVVALGVLHDPQPRSRDGSLSVGLLSRLTVVEGGWSATFGFELEWGR